MRISRHPVMADTRAYDPTADRTDRRLWEREWRDLGPRTRMRFSARMPTVLKAFLSPELRGVFKITSPVALVTAKNLFILIGRFKLYAQ